MSVSFDEIKDLAIQHLEQTDSRLVVKYFDKINGVSRWSAFIPGVTLYFKPNPELEYQNYISGVAIDEGTIMLNFASIEEAELKPRQFVMDNFQYGSKSEQDAIVLTNALIAKNAENGN